MVQLEDIQGFCDPNPTEYVDTEKSKPNVVFYWGLQDGKYNVEYDIKLIEEEFMSYISTFYDGCPGRMELSILQASELPKNAQIDDDHEEDDKSSESAKGTRLCWKKIADYDEKRSSPAYTQRRRLPRHFASCVAPNGGEAECVGSGG